MVLSFRGTFDQKVDSKGRMSVPAAVRRVLVDGDPDCPEGSTQARLVMLHGPHLQDHVEIYSIRDMAKIEAGIRKLPRGSKERKRAAKLILAHSWETEIDKDGRIILPKDLRDSFGLMGDVVFSSMGEYVELWPKAAFEEADDDWLGDEDEDFDPMSLVPDVEDPRGPIH